MDSGFFQISETGTPVREITTCGYIPSTTTAHQPSDLFMNPRQPPQPQQTPGMVAWATPSPNIVPQPISTEPNQNMIMSQQQQQQQWHNHLLNMSTQNPNAQYNHSVSIILLNQPIKLQ